MRPAFRPFIFHALIASAAILLAMPGRAQPPDDESGPPERPQRASREDRRGEAPSVERIVARLMAFDKNHDGKLTRDEITDPRLLRLFDRADTNHDGVVTKEELTALAKKMIAENNSGGGFRGPGGPGGGPGEGDGPGGFGGPGGGERGGPGGFGPGGGRRFGGPPQPGQILPPGLQDALKLTAAQKKKLAALQKEVDAKLAEILTDDQKRQIKSMRPRGDGPPPRDRRGQGNGPDGDGPPDDRF